MAWTRRVGNGRPSRNNPHRRHLWLESLEDRTVPSTILWANRGVPFGPEADHFNEVFGSRAELARNTVAAALRAWQDVIRDFHYADGTNTLTVNVAMGPSLGFGAAATYGGPWTDGNGKPTRGRIEIGTGDNAFGSGWFLDPDPLTAASFRGPIVNPYVALATPGSPAEDLHDLFSVVSIETAHVLGLNDADNEAFALDLNHYLTPTGQPDASDAPGTLWAFNGPDVQALFTTDNGDAESRPSALHVARPDPANLLQLNGRTFIGAEDTDNASYDLGQRYFPSYLDALVLKDVYGYEINPPTGRTFHALLDPGSGNLLVRGAGPGEGIYVPGTPSNDVITVGTFVSGGQTFYQVTVQIGNPVPGTGPNAPLVSTFPAARVRSLTIDVGEGRSTVNLRETTANVLTTITVHGRATVNLGIGGNLQGLRGSVTLAGGAGSIALNLDDSSDPMGRKVTLRDRSLSGLTPTGINFLPGVLSSLTIRGGRGQDAFTVVSLPSASVRIDGGRGANSLAESNGSNVWRITGPDTGSLNGTVTFTAVGGLVGGRGEDVFLFSRGANLSGSVNGGGGGNTLDYSAYAASLYVDLRTGSATAVRGGQSGRVTNVRNVTGSPRADVLIAAAVASVLKGGGGNDVLIGGPGNDVLIGGTGRTLLIGGSGADRLTAGRDTILVGGTTLYYKETTGAVNLTALHRILAEWQSTANLDVRVGHLTGKLPGGVNRPFLLNASTVSRGAGVDWFNAGAGGDWFLHGPADQFAGRVNLATNRKTRI
jgi:Ca2+-binding RTX toxin-like protein